MPGLRARQTSAPALASVSVPIEVFNTELRAEQEPNNASTSESKGHAQVKVLEDGSLEFGGIRGQLR
jgi:hypothetical protein